MRWSEWRTHDGRVVRVEQHGQDTEVSWDPSTIGWIPTEAPKWYVDGVEVTAAAAAVLLNESFKRS